MSEFLKKRCAKSRTKSLAKSLSVSADFQSIFTDAARSHKEHGALLTGGQEARYSSVAVALSSEWREAKPTQGNLVSQGRGSARRCAGGSPEPAAPVRSSRGRCNPLASAKSAAATPRPSKGSRKFATSGQILAGKKSCSAHASLRSSMTCHRLKVRALKSG